MLSHEAARGAIIVAFQNVFKRAPNRNEAQIAQAIALYESGYGSAAFINRETGERISDTNNWGAVHCTQSPPCPEGCFEATDTDAMGVPYQACFRRFPTANDGATFFIRTLYVGQKGTKYDRAPLLAAANKGDIKNVAEWLNRTVYSEAAVPKLQTALIRNLEIISKALGESMPASKGSGRWPLLVGIALTGVGVWYLWGLKSGSSSETT